MSESEENKPLLANDDGVAEPDDGQSAAMQKMMGFTSFGGPQKPKRQPRGPKPGKGFGTGANSQPVQKRQLSTSTTKSTLSATSHPFTPASLPPRPPKQARIASSTAVKDESYFQNLDPVQAVASPSPSVSTIDVSQPAPTTWDPTQLVESDLWNPVIVPHSAWDGVATDLPQAANSNSHLDEIAYTNPITKFTLTRRELTAYEHGVTEQVVNSDGSTSQVKVFFKPNFIDDDPWKGLERREGLPKWSDGTREVTMGW